MDQLLFFVSESAECFVGSFLFLEGGCDSFLIVFFGECDSGVEELFESGGGLLMKLFDSVCFFRVFLFIYFFEFPHEVILLSLFFPEFFSVLQFFEIQIFL